MGVFNSDRIDKSEYLIRLQRISDHIGNSIFNSVYDGIPEPEGLTYKGTFAAQAILDGHTRQVVIYLLDKMTEVR